MTAMHTPVTPAGLARHDDLEPERAVVQAWTDPGPSGWWHRRARRIVRDRAPGLFAAVRTMGRGQGSASARAASEWETASEADRRVVRDAMPLLARALDRLVDYRYDRS